MCSGAKEWQAIAVAVDQMHSCYTNSLAMILKTMQFLTLPLVCLLCGNVNQNDVLDYCQKKAAKHKIDLWPNLTKAVFAKTFIS